MTEYLKVWHVLAVPLALCGLRWAAAAMDGGGMAGLMASAAITLAMIANIPEVWRGKAGSRRLFALAASLCAAGAAEMILLIGGASGWLVLPFLAWTIAAVSYAIVARAIRPIEQLHRDVERLVRDVAKSVKENDERYDDPEYTQHGPGCPREGCYSQGENR